MNKFYTLIVITALLGTAGCASLMYGKKLTKNTAQLMAGMTSTEVTNALGEPDLVSADSGVTIWHYNLLVMNDLFERTIPYFVLFKDNKAVRFGVDENAARQQAIQELTRAQAFQNLGDQMNKIQNQQQPQSIRQPVSCITRSTSFGSTTDCN